MSSIRRSCSSTGGSGAGRELQSQSVCGSAAARNHAACLAPACRQQLEAGQLPASAAAQQLEQLRGGGVQLAARSLQLLSLSADAHAQQQFADESMGQPLGSSSWVTCMEVIRQAADEVRPCG